MRTLVKAVGEIKFTQALGHLLWGVWDVSKATTVLATSCEAARQIVFDEISSERLHGLPSIKFALDRYRRQRRFLMSRLP